MDSFFNAKLGAIFTGFDEVLKKGLQAAGAAYRAEIAIYPPQEEVAPGTPYKRTFSLRRTAKYELISSKEVDFTGRFYGEYVLGGTTKWKGWPGKAEAIKKRAIDALRKAITKGVVG